MLGSHETIHNKADACYRSSVCLLEEAKALLAQGYDIRQDSRFQEIVTFFAEQNYIYIPRSAAIEGLNPTTDVMRFIKLKQALTQGDYTKRFPVGMILPDIWVDPKDGKIYSAPLRIVDYQLMRGRDNKWRLAAILLRVYAHSVIVQFDAKEKPGAPDSRNEWGWNRWKFAGVRQYLNSDGRPGEWGLPTHEFDNPLDIAATEYGYLAGCSAELLQATSPAIIATDTYDDTLERTDFTEDLFFLPTMEDLHFKVDRRLFAKQRSWQYFQDTSNNRHDRCMKRAFLDAAGRPQLCLTRSACRGSANYVRASAPNGSADSYTARYVYACTPACVIFADEESSQA